MSSDASRAGSALPAVDDRLVAPDTPYEILDGVLVHVSPADPPHGTRHAQIAALVETHVGPELEVACDMLTRTSRTSDIAPDVSVFPEAPDPRTGGRQLEQIAFEVVSTGSIGHAGRKAASLVARGVRRVFAIDVERSRALEWSASLGTWSVIDPGGHIEDPVFAAPLPIDALVRSAKADDAIARALLAKHNPVLEAARASDRAEGFTQGKHEGFTQGKHEGFTQGKHEGFTHGRAEGIQHGLVEAVLAILAARGIPVDDAGRTRILGERDAAQLDRWLRRAATCTELAGMFEGA